MQMEKPAQAESYSFRAIALFALLFLVFFQLVTALVEATYTFGLLSVEIPPQVASVLFFLTPMLLFLFPGILDHRWTQRFALFTGLLALACRAAALAASPASTLILNGLGTGLFLLCLPALITLVHRLCPDAAIVSRGLGSGMGFAGLLYMSLRALEPAGLLPSTAAYRVTLWLLIALAAVLLTGWLRGAPSAAEQRSAAGQERAAPGFGRTLLLWLGWMSAFLLLYFAFTTPAVIARWTGADLVLVSALTVAPLAVLLILWLFSPGSVEKVSRPLLLAWNGLFVAALAALLLSYQVAFPANPEAFPVLAPAPGPLSWAALVITLLLHPVIYLDFALASGRLAAELPRPRRMAGGLSLAALFLMLMVFAQVLTTVYDYMPVVGPLFRDRFWLVFTIPGLGLIAASALRQRNDARVFRADLLALPALAAWRLIAVVGLTVTPLAAAAALIPTPAPAPAKNPLRVMTYNIQQGYDDQGHKNFAGQLAVIRQQDPDILGLEESDMARIANGNSDIVRYFASELDMVSYYGPSTVTGTFGIALLSRYPIRSARTFYMYSKGEQTAAIHAQVQVGETLYNVMVTHLGNGGPLVQQQQVLSELGGEGRWILMGDFNFNPSKEQYRVTTTRLEDAWELAQAKTPFPGQDLSRRIDHIFLSPGARVQNAAYLPEGPSDHPALVVDVGW